MNDKGVCVVIPAFNAQSTIARAVRSALAQDHVIEVIVCDDASQDNTSNIARLQDDGTHRLSVFTLARNSGPAAARNAAFAASRSPYVCLLDSDDYFLPGRIARLLNADGDEWDFLADDIVIAPEGLDTSSLRVSQPGASGRIITMDLAGFVRANISRPGQLRREWGFLKPLMRRAFLDQHGLQYNEELRLGEDYALYVRALMAGARFRVVPACGYVAVERNTSISALHSPEDLKRIAEFDSKCLAAAKLTGEERAAIAEHRNATQQKCDHRTVLEVKRERGFISALGALLRMQGSRTFIMSETLRAKTAAFLFLLGLRRQSTSGVRFLIGPPFSPPIARDVDGFGG